MKDLDNFDEVGMWVSTYPCSLMVSGASLHLCECPMKVILADWANRAEPKMTKELDWKQNEVFCRS